MTAVFAYMMAEDGIEGVILCGRELMNSLEESSMEEIKSAIRATPWLNAYFDIGEKYIRTKNKRISYVFCGLRHNLDSIKSKARVLLAWIDEAENVSDIAWKKLIPTVRGVKGSEIWVTWNPERENSPTDLKFRKNASPRWNKRCRVVEMNYQDNPWFPPELDGDRLDDLDTMSPEEYAWVWDGAYRTNSDAIVYAGKWKVEDFEPGKDWDGPYYGLDFGFANDPTAAVKCWIYDRRLWIERDFSQIKLEIDETPAKLKEAFPGIERYAIEADNARPESISYLKRHGLPRTTGVEKGPGSVEDGITFIKSFKRIVVHTRCVATKSNLMMYSYKVDRLSGKVMPDVVDGSDDCLDALRYSLEPIMKAKKGGLLDVLMAKSKAGRQAASAGSP